MKERVLMEVVKAEDRQNAERRFPYQIPNIDQKATAWKLRKCMEKAGLKPTDIQQYLRLSCVQTVYRWLDGTNVPTVDHLYALSRIFRVRLEELLVFSSSEPQGVEESGQMMRMKHYYHNWGIKYFGH